VSDADAARAWVDEFLDAFRAARDELDDLDRQSGDGDFGSNLLAAVQQADEALQGSAPGTPGDAFATLGTAFMGAGGTSGPLFGVWFRALARSTGDALDGPSLAAGAAAGVAAVQRLGSAEPGDKTMVDAMVPAAAALGDSAHRDLREAVAAAAAAAADAAGGTAGLLARRGRASYVGEVARGVRDPGAVAVAIFFEAGVRALGRASPDDHVGSPI
jgi:phosphoenolpyruvate---glycerone phosphotransferase subunit DhaL